MRKIDPVKLRKALEQLQQAAHDHAKWHDDLLRAIICGPPCDANDFAENAHQLCRFGKWYYGKASDEFREKPAFAAMEAEHRDLHRVGARMLRAAAAGAPVMRADYEELVAGGARLHLELGSLRQEIQAALRNRDALTGAYGRAEMLPDLDAWHALAQRGVQQCCIVFMDVDHLKEINDTYGHQLGDEVLTGVVRYLGKTLRPYDKVFRYGGDEFLISLPGADLATAQVVIARVREGFASSQLAARPDGTALRVTASFGLALLDPNVTVEESVERADQALMLAKTAGRNRAISWDPSVTTGTRLPRLHVEDVKG
jgi:diguanylate cyclase (GGDEF)-like protein